MPRKFGQHFLVRDAVLERLAAAACEQHVERTVEIGPGRGALTLHLLPRTDSIHAIEIDRQLVSYLSAKFAAEPKLEVHQGDVLETDLTQWGAAAITGNLPYYITSPILEKFFRLDERFPRAVFLVQWEVAERLLAVPRTRAFGYLTVITQLVCDVELLCKIPPDAFRPPPKVDSAAVILRRKADTSGDSEALRKFVGLCFRQKRKTLRNNLRGAYGPAVDDQPEASMRGEQLETCQFADLFRRLTPAGSTS